MCKEIAMGAMTTKGINHERKMAHLGVLSLSLICCLLFVLYPFDLDAQYRLTYATCSFLLVIICFCVMTIRDRRLGGVDPLSVTSVIYAFVYAVCPIYDILTGTFQWFGHDLFIFGPGATIVAAIGYLAFAITYKLTWHAPKKRIADDANQPKSFVPLILVMYAVCFAGNSYYMVSGGGNSLVYCLTLGVIGDGGGDKVESSIGFVSMLSYCLPAITLMYIQYGRSTFLKIAMAYAMLALQVSRGFRFIVFEIAIMFLCYYRFRYKRMPSLRVALPLAAILFAAVMLMTIFRSDIRSGSGMDLSSLSMIGFADTFDEMLWDNLRIYKNFYGMVGVIPDVYPFVYGQQIILGPLLMFVPRIIWPGKPETLKGGYDLDVLIGPELSGTGQAFPNLGEYWYAFGLIGVVLFMALYAWWMKRSELKYGNDSTDPLSWIMLAVLVSLNLQLIIRGYTPSNLWLIVFSILPIVVIRPLSTFLSSSPSEKKKLRRNR